MKKISVLLLALIMLILPIMSLSSCEKEATDVFFGEVVHIRDTKFARESIENHSYYVYVKPYGQKENIDWFLFLVNSDSETESKYNTDVTKMPELNIGTIVLITYNTECKEDTNNVICYYAKSIKTTTASSPKENKISLVINDSYDESDCRMLDYCGILKHVTRVYEPESGYLIYLESEDYTGHVLECFWIEDGSTVKSPEIVEKLNSGEIGYRLHIKELVGDRPLKKLQCYQGKDCRFLHTSFL